MTERHEITQLLESGRAGEPGAAARLMPLLYDELHAVAARHLRGERRDHTLQVTALVHEAFLELVEQEHQTYANRQHFLAIASQVMRRVLLHHAEKRRAQKRGGVADRVTLDEAMVQLDVRCADVLAIDDALKRLAALDEGKARIVELRFFGGLTAQECAEALGKSLRTVERDWRFARAWLRTQLSDDSADPR